MTGELASLGTDPAAARSLARSAIDARGISPQEARALAGDIDRRVESGTIPGRLWMRDGRPVGIILWEPPEPIGIAVRFCFLRPEHGSPADYRSLLEAVTSLVGPIAFVGSIAGGAEEIESRVLGSLGFAPFHRSEMRFPPGAPVPDPLPSPGLSLRPLRPSDARAVAAVHAAAYGAHFDRYLFLEDPDPRADAEKFLTAALAGRWGEFLTGASFVAETPDAVIGATIVVRSEGKALIADVAVDPSAQGRGVGRAMLVATLRALRERREPLIALAVTEENERARRLYEHLGFVRALGPRRLWYHPHVVPVPPGRG